MNTDTIVKAAWFDLLSNQIAQGAALVQAVNEARAKVSELEETTKPKEVSVED